MALSIKLEKAELNGGEKNHHHPMENQPRTCECPKNNLLCLMMRERKWEILRFLRSDPKVHKAIQNPLLFALLEGGER